MRQLKTIYHKKERVLEMAKDEKRELNDKQKKVYAKEGLLDFSIFDIDLSRLDEEWINQPKRFFRWASQLADAKERLDEQKARLDVVRAEVSLDIRERPSNYDLPDKLTENLISNAILQQDKYQEALKLVRVKKYRVDLVQAAVQAMDQRRSSLERLVSLHGQSYFATPRATEENAKEIVDKIEKDSVRSKGKKRKAKK